MSFFTTSTGEAINSTGSFDAGGGDFAPIPKDTRVLAICEEAKISEYQDNRYVNIKWDIAQPVEYKGRKIFQKVQCFDSDSQKRDKALRMLAAIDANAGGKLAASGKEPTDMALMQALGGRQMVLKLGVWELDDKSKSGNWVQEVSKRAEGGKPAPAQPPAPRASAGFDDMDDDIPFMNPMKSRAFCLSI